MKKGKLFIITGPSAVGKTSIAKLVLKKKKDLIRSITFTSRNKRPGEKNGRDYHFITEKEFKKKIRKSDFLEWANNYGNLYGTDKKEIIEFLNRGRNVLVVIDIKGALNIKKKWPGAATIFILPESTDQLKKRFQKRSDTAKVAIKKRLETAEWELSQSPKCDYWVINPENRIELAVKEALEIIKNA
ncbi:guanylate kinase [Patescibacteria group bacterium]|nr:guanylate kinase [Patescibacteria group bacterium]